MVGELFGAAAIRALGAMRGSSHVASAPAPRRETDDVLGLLDDLRNARGRERVGESGPYLEQRDEFAAP